jgi:hypothetical protein
MGLKGFEGFRFESFDVDVVNGSGFRKDFIPGYGGEETGLRNALRPLLAELCAILSQCATSPRRSSEGASLLAKSTLLCVARSLASLSFLGMGLFRLLGHYTR